MILLIDASDSEQVRLALVSSGVVWHKFSSKNLSEQLLPEIKKFGKKQKIELNKLHKIAVVVGPGGFSRIRTAVSTANALAFGLGIPVLGFKQSQMPADLARLDAVRGQQLAVPFYDKTPHITVAKKSK